MPGNFAKVLIMRHVLCLLASFSLLFAAPTFASEKLSVLTWSEFIGPSVIKELRSKYGIELLVTEFTSAEERMELLQKRGDQFDLVNGDTNALDQLRRGKFIDRIDFAKIPNSTHINKILETPSRYAIPYTWGYTGIAWRTDLVRKPLKTYKDLFDLAQANPGKVGLIEGNFEALSAALFAYGHPPYTMLSPTEVAAAQALLLPQLKNTRMVSLELDETDGLVTGKIIAQQVYNGDAAFLRDTHGAKLAFAVPEPGCLIWTENFMLMKNAPHRDTAYRFLDIINTPAIAARNAEEIRYASANASAAKSYSSKFKEDPIIRPMLDGLVKCQFYRTNDRLTEQAINNTSLQ